MSFFVSLSRFAFALAFLTVLTAAPASANERRYFKNIEGRWTGAGTIAAGPYKGTRFTCNFNGNTPKRVGMELVGQCRVGIFPQAMSAKIYKRGRSYRGRFTLGSGSDGLDIVSGRLRGKKLRLGIKHKDLRGQFIANLKSRNRLNLTIAVKVQNSLVPFIGLTLRRAGT